MSKFTLAEEGDVTFEFFWGTVDGSTVALALEAYPDENALESHRTAHYYLEIAPKIVRLLDRPVAAYTLTATTPRINQLAE
jgi:quinol monooxygenase YgiN